MSQHTIDDIFLETTRLDVHEMVRQLNSHLGPTLVATLANVNDRKLPGKWAQPGGVEPRPESLRRLQAAHRCWTTVSMRESDHVARAWFIGANPRLEEVPPVVALREGRVAEVLNAAQSFVEGCGGAGRPAGSSS
jgi:hypothetical protein